MTLFMTPPGRMQFGHLFEPREAQKNDDGTLGKPKYEVGALLLPPDTVLTSIQTGMLACVKEKFGDDASKWPGPARDKARVLPIRDAGTKDYDGYLPGWNYITARSDKKPELYYGKRDAQGKLIPLTKQSDIFNGCWVSLLVDSYWRRIQKNPGVSLDLKGVVLIRPDEPFVIGGGPRVDVDDAFKDVKFDAGVFGDVAGGDVFAATDNPIDRLFQ